jgi:hypothetical protein
MNRVGLSHGNRIAAIMLLAAPAMVVISGCSDPLPPSNPPHSSSTTVSPPPSVSSSTAGTIAASPTPTGTPVCDALTEIGSDLNTLQFGPSDNEPQELHAIGSLLSQVVGETSQESSDLSSLNQDYNTTVTDSGDGTDEDQGAILTGISNMNDDLNALQSDCSGS